MAKHPDWSTKDPSWSKTVYWTSTASVSDPSSGYWTTNNGTTNPNFETDLGKRSYTLTPGFNSPMRKEMIKPLYYSAQYETWKADFSSHQTEIRTINVPPPGGSGPSTPVDYVYQDTTSTSHNQFRNGFKIGDYNASSVDRRATNKLLENLKDQKVNLAQAFAEREETVKTVTSTIKTVASALTQLHKGNFAGAAKAFGIKPPKRGQRRFNKTFANDASNAVADGWLSLQYGWRPLLQDVYGAAETLAQASLGPENKNSVFARAVGQSRKSLDLMKNEINSNPGFSGFDVTTYTCRGFYLVRYGVRYTRSSAPVSSLAKLGILNPAQLAWELVPYSFVVDWFFPIGNWLGGLDATAGLAFESGYCTTLLKYECSTYQNQSIRSLPPERKVRELSDNEFKKLTTMSRSTLSGFPSAPAPSFKNPLSMSHLASAMALLKQFKR